MEPTTFARRYGVTLADDVYPETSFKRDLDDPESDGRIMQRKFNIHLVRHGAIRLLVERDKDHADWVRSIELNPSILLYAEKKQPHRIGDLALSLSILSKQVSPLLAEPLDACHIVPGLAKNGRPVAFWSMVDSEVHLPGILIPCLHDLSHPDTGPAEGVKNNRIQLGDKRDDCVVRFKDASITNYGKKGKQKIPALRVRLILKKRSLIAAYQDVGTTARIADIPRLVAFPESGIAQVHLAQMAQLTGTYLPIPPLWIDKEKTKNKSVTTAKVIALTSALASIPVDKLRAMDVKIRQPSESTLERLEKALKVATKQLHPIEVSKLFAPLADSLSRPAASCHPDDIDPVILEVYGGA